MAKEKLYVKMAGLVMALRNSVESGREEWVLKHTQALKLLTKDHMPSGAGFDNGTKIVLEECTEEKLVFTTSFHHMNENGVYDGWTEHKVIVKPSLFSGFVLKITGKDRNDTKDYIHASFVDCLYQEIED